MPNFHDPYVQFVTAITVAIIAIVIGALVALWIYFKQKNKKELSYSLISSAPIVSVKSDVADRIKIYLDGDVITQAQLAVFSIKNTGNRAVTRDDYDEPIVIDFPGCKILDGNIISTKPNDLLKLGDRKTFFEWKHSTLTLAKYLLNPKDGIEFSVLVEGADIEPKVRARIVEGVLVKEKPSVRISIMLPFLLVATLPTIATYLIYIISNYDDNNVLVRNHIDIMIFALLPICAVIIAIMQWIAPRKQ